MPSNKPVIMIRTTEEIIEKFKIISKDENRSMSKQAEKLIIDCIKKYEKENGAIDLETLEAPRTNSD